MPSIQHMSAVPESWQVHSTFAHLPLPGPTVDAWVDAKPPEQQPIFRRAIERLLNHHEDGISMMGMVKPLIAEVAMERKPAQLTLARAMCLTMVAHNQDQWLHDRMTFHGLADIQTWGQTAEGMAVPASPKALEKEPPTRLGIIQVSERAGGNVRASHGWLEREFHWVRDNLLYQGTLDGVEGICPTLVHADRVGKVRTYDGETAIPGLKAACYFDPAQSTFGEITRQIRLSLGRDFAPPVAVTGSQV